ETVSIDLDVHRLEALPGKLLSHDRDKLLGRSLELASLLVRQGLPRDGLLHCLTHRLLHVSIDGLDERIGSGEPQERVDRLARWLRCIARQDRRQQQKQDGDGLAHGYRLQRSLTICRGAVGSAAHCKTSRAPVADII